MAIFYEKKGNDQNADWISLDGGIDESLCSPGKPAGDFSLLRDVLGDNHNMGAIRVRMGSISKREGDILHLVFPVYLYDFVEDTFARVLHHRIEGCGYAYRECVGRRTIRLREYDGLFRRIVSEDRDTACEIAFGRVLYPFDIAPGHLENYNYFLEQFGIGTIESLLGEGFPYDSFTCIEYLCQNCLINRETADEGIEICGDGHAEIVAKLLNYKRSHWSDKRKRLSLEDI